MKKLLLLIVVIACHNVTAQKQGKELVDSLEKVVQTNKIDTAGILTLTRLSYSLSNIAEYDSAMMYANRALSLSNKIGFIKGKATAMFNIGRVLDMQGHYTEGLKNYLASLQLNLAINNREGLGYAYNNIGAVYYDQGNYAEALKNFLASLKYREEIGDKQGLAVSYTNIGNIYDYYKDYPLALRYWNAALKLASETGNKKSIALLYNSIGSLYFKQNKKKEALDKYNESKKISESTGDKDGIASSCSELGHFHLEAGSYAEALQYYFQSLKIRQEIEDKEGIASTYTDIGEVYVKQNRPQAGKQWLEKSLSLAKELGNKDDIIIAYNKLSEADSSLGDYKAAYLHHKLYIACRDSVTNEGSTNKIVQQLVQYDFDKKEAEANIAHEKELLKQKFIRNSILAGFVVILAFSLVVFRQMKKIKKGKQLSDKLLLNILPAEVAEELKETGSSKAKSHNEVTVVFTDFVNFTAISEKLTAEQVVSEIDTCFKAFDHIIEKYGLEKIKTIGDAYMAASGMPVADEQHAIKAVQAAVEMSNYMRLNGPVIAGERLQMRIGINSGRVVAGIVGVRKFAYDIWGDTVNTAARIEQHGVAGRINLSGSTYELVKHQFNCEYRGKINAKSKGDIDMYFVKEEQEEMRQESYEKIKVEG